MSYVVIKVFFQSTNCFTNGPFVQNFAHRQIHKRNIILLSCNAESLESTPTFQVTRSPPRTIQSPSLTGGFSLSLSRFFFISLLQIYTFFIASFFLNSLASRILTPTLINSNASTLLLFCCSGRSSIAMVNEQTQTITSYKETVTMLYCLLCAHMNLILSCRRIQFKDVEGLDEQEVIHKGSF